MQLLFWKNLGLDHNQFLGHLKEEDLDLVQIISGKKYLDYLYIIFYIITLFGNYSKVSFKIVSNSSLICDKGVFSYLVDQNKIDGKCQSYKIKWDISGNFQTLWYYNMVLHEVSQILHLQKIWIISYLVDQNKSSLKECQNGQFGKFLCCVLPNSVTRQRYQTA